MPFGGFLNAIPPFVFIIVHLVGFLVGAYFAYRLFNHKAQLMGWGFGLYALAELVYMTYHLDWTVFLFAHTIAEVLDLVGFILIFVGVARTMQSTTQALKGTAQSMPGTPMKAA